LQDSTAPDDRRASKTAGGQTTYYVYDEDGSPSPLIEEQMNSGTATVSMGWGRGADGLRARYSPTTGGPNYMFEFDPQGSLVQRQTGSNTSLPALDTAMYDAYGSRLNDVDAFTGGVEPVRDAVGFQGQFGAYTDTETGLVLMGHRYYSPGTGRFLTRDPKGYGGGINLYGFTGNNPVNEMDPEGLSKDPFPEINSDPGWIRVSTALFIQRGSFRSGHPQGGVVTHKGDGRGFNYNTDADRVRVDFAFNPVTGAIIKYPAHTAGSQMTLSNGFVEKATAELEYNTVAKKTATGWQISVSGSGTDPFYDIMGMHMSPPASFSAVFNFSHSALIGGAVNYRDFPATEIYAYNKNYSGGHKFLFGYKPSHAIQYGIGPGELYHGERNHATFSGM